jgi:hypothetical protein
MLAAAAVSLDPRLEAEAIPIGDLSLSAVLLLNDSRFPWFCSSRAGQT